MSLLIINIYITEKIKDNLKMKLIEMIGKYCMYFTIIATEKFHFSQLVHWEVQVLCI